MKNNNILLVIIGLGIAVLVCGGVAIGLWFTMQADGPPPEEPSSLSEPAEEESSSEPEEEEEGEDEPADQPPATPEVPPVASSEPVYTPPATSTTRPASSVSQPAVPNLVIDKSGTNSTQETVRNLYIEATPAVVKNKTVTGDIIIKAGAGTGNVTLENIRATGNIFVSGGGDNVTLTDVTAAGMVADRATGTQTIKLAGQTSIPTMWAKGHVVLDESGLGNAPGVNDLYSQDGGRIWNDVTLKGARLSNVGTATPTNITVPADSSVDKITAGAQTHVAGTGNVRNLTASSNDVTYETKPVNVAGSSDSYTPTSSAGKIGDTNYGIASTSSGTSSNKTYSKGKLTTPRDLELYVTGNDIYASFTGDKNAKDGYTITPIIDGKRQREVEVKGAGKGTPPEHTDVLIINNANSLRNHKVAFEVVANEVDSKYAPSSPARSANQTVYETTGFAQSSLNVTRSTKDEYTVSWDQLEFYRDSSGSNIRPGGTTYYIDYTVRAANGSIIYQPTGRASTNKTTYKIPVMPKNLEDGAQISVTVYAETNTDVYPCTLNPDLEISGTFKLGKLPTPTGLTALLPPDGYKLETKWAAVAGAKDYTVTALVNEGGTLREVSQTVTGTSHTFTGLTTKAAADNVSALSFRVIANAPANSIYDASLPATSSAIAVPIKLPAPGQASMKIVLITNVGATDFSATWATVPHAAKYRLFATHYDKDGGLVTQVNPEIKEPPAQTNTTGTQTTIFTDNVGTTVRYITFSAQTLAYSESWYRDSDVQESNSFSARIYLDPPKQAEMEIKLSVVDRTSYTVSWGKVDHADGYRVLPVYNGDDPWTTQGYQVVVDKNTTTYTYHITNDLQGNPFTPRIIAFRVYALAPRKTGTDDYSTWYSDSDFTDSKPVYVNTPAPTPTNVSIELTDGRTKAIIRWNSVPDAKEYNLVYYLEKVPGVPEKIVVPLAITAKNTARMEYEIPNIKPNEVRSVQAEVQTVPEPWTWNDNSAWSARAVANINAVKLVKPTLPFFTRTGDDGDATWILNVTWSAGQNHNTTDDEFAVWKDLPNNQRPDRDNLFYHGSAAASSITVDGQPRTHHIMIGAVPKVYESNREQSEILDFYILTGTKIKSDNSDSNLPQGHGILLPTLDNAYRLSDPIVYVDAFIVENNTDKTVHQRGFALSGDGSVKYDGSQENFLVRLDNKYTDWNTLTGTMYLQLKTQGGRIYQTEAIAKPIIP